MGSPRPLAVAMLDVAGMNLVEQVAARILLVEQARTEGYDLLQVLEVGGGRRDDDVYAAALDLARRTDARAFVVHGDVDHDQLRTAASDLPARIITTTDHSPTPPPALLAPVAAAGAAGDVGPVRPTGARAGGTPSTAGLCGRRPAARFATFADAR